MILFVPLGDPDRTVATVARDGFRRRRCRALAARDRIDSACRARRSPAPARPRTSSTTCSALRSGSPLDGQCLDQPEGREAAASRNVSVGLRASLVASTRSARSGRGASREVDAFRHHIAGRCAQKGGSPGMMRVKSSRDLEGCVSLINKGQNTPGLYFDVASNKFILERSNVAEVAQESGSTTSRVASLGRHPLREWGDHACYKADRTSRPASARRRSPTRRAACSSAPSCRGARASS